MPTPTLEEIVAENKEALRGNLRVSLKEVRKVEQLYPFDLDRLGNVDLVDVMQEVWPEVTVRGLGVSVGERFLRYPFVNNKFWIALADNQNTNQS